MKTGLVLEGGGMRGLYTAGVLDYFSEKGFMPDVICGASAGVTFGVNLPSGQPGRVLRYNTRFAGKREYISLFSLMTTGDIVNPSLAYDRLPRELDPFDNDAFKRSGVEFYASVTNLLSGKAEHILLSDCDAQMDVIKASASLPFVSRKVFLDGVPYLDGGLTDNIPLEKCLELGCDKIIVILTHPEGFVRKGDLSRAARLFYHRYPAFIDALKQRNENYNACVAKVERLAAKGRLILIRPSQPLTVSRLESDPEKMRQAHELGLKDAAATWNSIASYLTNNQ